MRAEYVVTRREKSGEADVVSEGRPVAQLLREDDASFQLKAAENGREWMAKNKVDGNRNTF